jgi:metalloendopeptidase OMA1, mitochondrial
VRSTASPSASFGAADGDPDEWEIAVIEDDTANAFALPGGKIGVHTGLFEVIDNEAQLAAVVAHEVAHVTQNHGQARMNQNALLGLGLGILGAAFDLGEGAQKLAATAATLGVVLPFSRDQETEADAVGLQIMARAGYDPREAIKVWENFEKAGGNGGPEFLQTHPSPDHRGQRLEAMLPDVMPIYREHAQDEERTVRATPRNRGERGDRVTQKGVYDIRDR